MEQTQAAPEMAAPKEPSTFSQLVNVYAAPGEVFERIKSAPRKNALWVIPIVLGIIIGIFFVLLVFSDPAIQSQMREQAEKRIQKMIDEGSIPPERAEMAREQAASMTGGTMGKVFGIIAIIIYSFAALLVVSLVFLLVGKIGFKTTVPYGKFMEVVGASTMINGVLGSIITMLIVLAMGSLYSTPGLALLISGFDPQNKVHALLSSVNIFTIWYLAVLSIGLGKLFSATTSKAAVWVVALWLVWTLLTTFVLTFLRMG